MAMKKKKRTAGLVLVLVCASSGIVAAAPDEQLDEYTLDTVVVEANRTKNKFGDIVLSSPTTARAATSTSSPARTSRSGTTPI